MHEFPWATQSLAMQIYPKQILASLDKFVIAAVPYFHRPRTVLPLVDLALEIRVFQFMILHLDSQTLDRALGRRLFGNRPTLQYAVHFQP